MILKFEVVTDSSEVSKKDGKTYRTIVVRDKLPTQCRTSFDVQPRNECPEFAPGSTLVVDVQSIEERFGIIKVRGIVAS